MDHPNGRPTTVSLGPMVEVRNILEVGRVGHCGECVLICYDRNLFDRMPRRAVGEEGPGAATGLA
jgi:hypothetical protein